MPRELTGDVLSRRTCFGHKAKAVQRNSSLRARIESHGSPLRFARGPGLPRCQTSSTIDHERSMSDRLKVGHGAKRFLSVSPKCLRHAQRSAVVSTPNRLFAAHKFYYVPGTMTAAEIFH